MRSTAENAKGTWDVVGRRVLVGVQMVDISRLSAHPVPITTGGLITVAGQGPKDSNGAGKSSFIAALSLLHADEQRRLAGGAPGAAATLAATLLALRNAIYGVQLNAAAPARGWPRWLRAHLTIDESFAVSTAHDHAAERRRGFWTAGVGVWVAWNLFTLVGALAGQALGDPRRMGLDGAAVAAFVGLLWPRLRGGDAWATAVVCSVVTVVLVPALPPGLPIVVAAVVAAILGWWRPRRREA